MFYGIDFLFSCQTWKKKSVQLYCLLGCYDDLPGFSIISLKHISFLLYSCLQMDALTLSFFPLLVGREGPDFQTASMSRALLVIFFTLLQHPNMHPMWWDLLQNLLNLCLDVAQFKSVRFLPLYSVGAGLHTCCLQISSENLALDVSYYIGRVQWWLSSWSLPSRYIFLTAISYLILFASGEGS